MILLWHHLRLLLLLILTRMSPASQVKMCTNLLVIFIFFAFNGGNFYCLIFFLTLNSNSVKNCILLIVTDTKTEIKLLILTRMSPVNQVKMYTNLLTIFFAFNGSNFVFLFSSLFFYSEW